MWLSFIRSDYRLGREIGLTLDTDRLPPERFGELLRAIETWVLVGSEDDPPQPSRGDRTVYVMTLEAEGQRRRVTVTEGAIPKDLQELVRWLDQRAHG